LRLISEHNKRPGVDVGWRVLLPCQRPQPRATRGERSHKQERMLHLFARSCLVFIAIGFAGCASPRTKELVVVNQRMGYVKILDYSSSEKLLAAVSRGKTDPTARSFDDLHGEGYWGGRMYDVYVPVKGTVCVLMFTFDSSGFLVEERSGRNPGVKKMGREDGSFIYRLLSPWKNGEEERMADEKPKEELKWGLFP
jgi:hypothetical protein